MLPLPLASHSPGPRAGSSHFRSEALNACPHLLPTWTQFPEAALPLLHLTLCLLVQVDSLGPVPASRCDCFIPVSSVQPIRLILSHRLPSASPKFSLMAYTLHAPFTMERGHVLAPQLLFQLPHSSSCDFCTLRSAKNLTSYLPMSSQGVWASTS